MTMRRSVRQGNSDQKLYSHMERKHYSKKNQLYISEPSTQPQPLILSILNYFAQPHPKHIQPHSTGKYLQMLLAVKL